MKRKIEKHYGKAVRKVMKTVNPIKKLLIKTYCEVHKFINTKSLEVIKMEGFEDEYSFYLKYMRQMNAGTVWADQDFKSTNHFYHYLEQKGLYGFSNALIECEKYYSMSINFATQGNLEAALFYFGVACHLIQDATVPQHVNNKLLNSHRNFELWIIKKLRNGYKFVKTTESKRYNSIEEYIKANAIKANETYNAYLDVADTETRYELIANSIMEEAVKTTAGIMLDFYEILEIERK